jgi:uncharacterized ubiquitin-like protein YukD
VIILREYQELSYDNCCSAYGTVKIIRVEENLFVVFEKEQGEQIACNEKNRLFFSNW